MVGDFVIINGEYRGTVEEVRARFIMIREWSRRLLMLSYSQIHEI
ncbi:mechanosensitive ion channel domain-containing protein [Alkalihalobacillus deserti]|nr:mechanosensitive ion channel domain-containing protein [Alkalihalobacillus deserti]